MKVDVVPIGNSRGIRIPKPILQQCHIKKYVDLEVENEHIVIEAYHTKPRRNWEQAFEKMHQNKDDRLFIDDNLDIDTEKWTW